MTDQTRPTPPPRQGEPTTMRFRGVPEGGEFVEVEGGLTSADHATIQALRPGTALLVVMRGPNNGARFLLDDESVSAGRHPDSDIFLDDITVSRRHAEVVRTADGYRLRDAGSLNGTYLNRERIDDAPIGDGDELQIGKYKLLFLLPRP